MQSLVDKLNKYIHAYYVLDNPLVSDSEFDLLYDELVALELASGRVLPDSPTRKVGIEAAAGFKKYTHKNRLYSLDKCKTIEELLAWCNKINTATGKKNEFSLEYKLDGLTLCVTYFDGLLQSAATRGNGVEGEIVTNQVLTIPSIPLKIEYTGHIEVNGEGIMHLSSFAEYNTTAQEPLKNPRNGAAGAIRSLDPSVTRARKIDCVFYGINYLDDNFVNSQSQAIEFLRTNKFKTEKIFVTSDIETLVEKIQAVDKSKLDFEIDGMVIKVNDFSTRTRLGYTDKFPKWAMAYKFEAEEVTTTVLSVIWQVGRTGKLTPVAMLQPVELAGVTVSRATLNNQDDINRKGVYIGARVFIRRSGDVIPEILGVCSDNNNSMCGDTGENTTNMPPPPNASRIEKPTTCPSCGAAVIENGVHIFCENKLSCQPQIEGRISHYCAKDCMNIEGVSDKSIAQFCSILNVKNPSDLYALTEKDLSKLDGFKAKKISNFLEGLQKSKAATLAQFIFALGIPHIGKKSAKDLAVQFGSIDELSQATKEQLLAVFEIGEIMADSIIEFFNQNVAELQKLKQHGINPIYTKPTFADNSNYFFGKKIVITGTLSQPRRDLAKQLEALGAEVQSAITKDTLILMAGENAGSKLAKAQKLGIEILSEEDFKSKTHSKILN